MNGFIARSSRILLVLSALGAVSTNGWAQEACATAAEGESCPVSDGEYCSTCNKKHGWWQNLKQRCREFDKEQLHPDHCWPEQYGRESQRRIYVPLGQQLLNGQKLEGTLWEHYFETSDDLTDLGTRATLNPAGESRLRYLARKRPYPVTNLQMQTSFNNDLDARRIAAVQEYLATVTMGNGVAWNVELANLGEPRGLFGQEGPKSIYKMLGAPGATPPPLYEPQIKSSFLTGEGEEQ